MERAPITLPSGWPPRIARRVCAELLTMFGTLGIEVALFVLPTREREAPLRAEGTVTERWKTIQRWLEQEDYTDVLDLFGAPATAAAIVVAESAMGIRLPADYREFLLLRDGQEPYAMITPIHRLLSLHAVVEYHRDLLTPPLPGWLVIGVSSQDRHLLCLDLSSSASLGGQVVQYDVADGARQVVATSFGALLGSYFEQLQSGEIVIDY